MINIITITKREVGQEQHRSIHYSHFVDCFIPRVVSIKEREKDSWLVKLLTRPVSDTIDMSGEQCWVK